MIKNSKKNQNIWRFRITKNTGIYFYTMKKRKLLLSKK